MRWYKIFIGVFLFGALSFLGLAWYVSERYGEIVRDIAIEALNENTQVPIHIESVEISPISNIPYLSIRFNNVQIKEPEDETKILLDAETVYFQFDILEILNGNYNLQRVSLKSGVLNLRNDPDGPNYIIWKKQNANDSSSVSLNLESIELSDMLVNYQHKELDLNIKGFINRADLKGNFRNDELALKFKASIDAINLSSEGVQYLRNTEMKITSGITLDTESGDVLFDKGDLRVNDAIDLTTKGRISGNTYSFQLKSGESEYKDISRLISERKELPLHGLGASGTLSFDVTIADEGNESKGPLFNVDFRVRDASVRMNKSVTVGNISFQGRFTNGKARDLSTSMVKLDSIRINQDWLSAKGEVLISQLRNPLITIKAAGVCNTSKFEVPVSGETAFSIQAAFTSEIFSDSLRNLDAIRNIDAKFSFQNAVLKTPGLDAAGTSFSGEVKVTKDAFRITKMECKLVDHLFRGEITAENYLEWWLEKKKLRMLLKLNSPSIDLEKLMDLRSLSEEGSGKNGMNVQIQVDLSANQLMYRDFISKDLTAKALINNNRIKVNPLVFKSAQGDFKGRMSFDFSNGPGQIALHADITEMEISEIFAQFKDFGQDEITNEQIKGKVSAEVHMTGELNKDLTVNSESLNIESDLLVRNGQLTNNPTMISVADYFRSNLALKTVFKPDRIEEKLRTIQFNTLKNKVSIREGKVFIPEMVLSSNVLDLNMSGVHGFDQTLNYRMNFDISELLVDNRSYESEFGKVEDDGTGRFHVFLKVTGTVQEPLFEIDKTRKKQHRKAKSEDEKRELREALRHEFGWFKDDTAVVRSKKTIDFDIEWEEDDQVVQPDSSESKQPKETEQKKKKKKWLEPNKEEYEEFDFSDDDL
jgi:hypothetical protein